MELVAFFVATYLVTWGALAPLVVTGATSGPLSLGAVALFLVASISLTLVAMGLSLLSGGPTGLINLLKQAGRWQFCGALVFLRSRLPDIPGAAGPEHR